MVAEVAAADEPLVVLLGDDAGGEPDQRVPEYVPLKRRVLHDCLRARAETTYAAGEERYLYPAGDVEPPTTYRYPHDRYWRAAAVSG